MLIPESDYFDAEITTSEAAEEFGVDKSTICSWVRKGYLTAQPVPAIRMGRKVPVYLRGDVALADKRAHRNAPGAVRSVV